MLKVDGYIFVQTGELLMTGDFAKVRVTGALEYDLIGVLSDEPRINRQLTVKKNDTAAPFLVDFLTDRLGREKQTAGSVCDFCHNKCDRLVLTVILPENIT